MTTSAMEWAIQDVGEDPNDTPSEGGLTDKEQIFIIVRFTHTHTHDAHTHTLSLG